MSPLGAVRRRRGPLSLDANSFTSKPLGTESLALAGRSETRGLLPTDFEAKGRGNLSISMRWTVPGASFSQSPALLSWCEGGALRWAVEAEIGRSVPR